MGGCEDARGRALGRALAARASKEMIGASEEDALSRAVNAANAAAVVGRSIMLRRNSERASNSLAHIMGVKRLTWRMLSL